MGNFFDYVNEKNQRKAAPAAASAAAPPLTVSQLTAQIDGALRRLPQSLAVKGEVSNLNHHRASGHLYFTLKDPHACIDCVMFKSDFARVKFQPADGMELIVSGRVAVYPQRGRYQLYVTRLDPIGQGALELAFRQLCEKLQAEGLFAKERKKPLPRFPMRIAVVTSTQTAALQDMLKVLRRFPYIDVLVYHVSVQGDGAAEQIAGALRDIDRCGPAMGIELILLGRGGGSLEDLWEFNEEIVARAIAACHIPIVTGIGHEVDVSIADLVADHHAHTPTEAAQVATSQWRTARDLLDSAGMRLRREIRAVLADARQRLLQVQRHPVFRRPLDRINVLRQFMDDRQRALSLAMGTALRRLRERLFHAAASLHERHPRHAVELARQRIVALRQRLISQTSADLVRRRHKLEAISASSMRWARSRSCGAATASRRSRKPARSSAVPRSSRRAIGS